MHSSFRLLLLAAQLLAECFAQQLQTLAPRVDEIPNLFIPTQGIAAFLNANPNYTLFYDLLDSHYEYSMLLSGAWAQGPTNNTVLVPTNAAIEAGFASLATIYGVPSNVTIYLDLAREAQIGQGTKSLPIDGAIANLVTAILSSHIVNKSINFYADEMVLNSTIQTPVMLPVSGINSTYAPLAYNVVANGEDDVTVSQPTGLLVDAVSIPKQYAQQLGSNAFIGGAAAVLYLYEVSTILVASEVNGGIIPGGSVVDALSTIKATFGNR